MKILKNKKFTTFLVLIALIVFVQLLINYLKSRASYNCPDMGPDVQVNCVPSYPNLLGVVSYDSLVIIELILFATLPIYLIVNLFIWVKNRIKNKDKVVPIIFVILSVTLLLVALIYIS